MKLTFHGLRHTFGSRLVEQGIHPLIIMRLMRHRSLTTTQRYLHVVDDQLRAAVHALDAGTSLEATKPQPGVQ